MYLFLGVSLGFRVWGGGGSDNKDHSILGSILASPYGGKLSCISDLEVSEQALCIASWSFLIVLLSLGPDA